MPTTTDIDGIRCTLEKLPDGTIRVSHESAAINPMHGPGTGGAVWYIVHPFQRNEFELLNNLLPLAERAVPTPTLENRPWWSYVPGKKGQSQGKHKDEGE